MVEFQITTVLSKMNSDLKVYVATANVEHQSNKANLNQFFLNLQFCNLANVKIS